jgi:hypothetical protein
MPTAIPIGAHGSSVPMPDKPETRVRRFVRERGLPVLSRLRSRGREHDEFWPLGAGCIWSVRWLGRAEALPAFVRGRQIFMVPLVVYLAVNLVFVDSDKWMVDLVRILPCLLIFACRHKLIRSVAAYRLNRVFSGY